MSTEATIQVLDMDTFERLAKPTDFFEKTRQALQREREKGAFDRIRAERERVWGLLANQVVGHENI
jgi:hypothetical protein